MLPWPSKHVLALPPSYKQQRFQAAAATTTTSKAHSSATFACRFLIRLVVGCCRLDKAEKDLETRERELGDKQQQLARLQEDFDIISRELTDLKAQGNTKEQQKEMQVGGECCRNQFACSSLDGKSCNAGTSVNVDLLAVHRDVRVCTTRDGRGRLVRVPVA
jgi:hypothetical protein